MSTDRCRSGQRCLQIAADGCSDRLQIVCRSLTAIVCRSLTRSSCRSLADRLAAMSFDRFRSSDAMSFDRFRCLPRCLSIAFDVFRDVFRNLSHNTPKLILPLESVVITHPIHPLGGQSVPLLRRLQVLGRPTVLVRFPDGHAAKIPQDWTDLRPVVPPLQLQGRCPLLHPAALLQVRARVDELMHKASSAAKLDAAAPPFPSSLDEPFHAENDVPRVVPQDPAPIPRRGRQPPAPGRGSAPQHRGDR